jgi:conjugal transfer pilus assembly protein TrbC
MTPPTRSRRPFAALSAAFRQIGRSRRQRTMALLVVASSALGAAALLPALAQTHRGVEVGRLLEESMGLQAELSDFMREVSRRGQEMRGDAEAVQAAAERNAAGAAALVTGEPAEGPLDFDQMLASAKDVRGAERPTGGPLFIAFASTSMPPEALRQLALDVTRAGGIVVFRGFPENNGRLFGQRLAKALRREDATENIGIDPRLFRAFHVEMVPTYVVTSSEVDLCDGLSCVSEVPAHDRMTGNVTADYALRTFAGGGGPSSAAARVFLRRLEAGASG